MLSRLQWTGLLLLALCSTVLAQNPCPTEADIVIIIDTSDCMGSQANFDVMKSHISAFLQMSHGTLDTQYSFISSSTQAQTIAYFNDDVDLDNVMDEFAIAPGYQNTHLALDEAATHFTDDNGHREGALKLVVLYAEGNPRDAGNSETSALALKDSDVTIFAMAIGPSANVNGLNALASDDLTYDGKDLGNVPSKHVEMSQAIADHATSECDPCPEEVDIVVMLDASGSLTFAEFSQMVDSMPDLFDREVIAGTHVRHALIQFSTFGVPILNFNTELPPGLSITQLPFYEGQQTYTHLGLDLAPGMFTPESGYKPNALKRIIIYTDGNSTDAALAKASADALKNDGVIIYVVGVGSGQIADGLADLASEGLVFDGTDLTTLPAVHDKIEAQIVEEIDGYCGKCPSKADVMVIVDASGSISSADFNILKGHVQAFVSEEFAGLDTIYALATFSTFLSKDKYFNDDVDASFMAQILQYQGQQTKTSLALNAVPEYFSYEKGHRLRSLRYVVIFTDGNSTDAVETMQAATNLKENFDITIIGIGVGSNVLMPEVTELASEEYAFDGSNMADLNPGIFDQINAKVENKVKALCGECPDKADVLIILDASDSTDECEFEKVKKNIADHLVNAPFPLLNTHYAFMQFSTCVRRMAYFNRNSEINPKKFALNRFVHQEGGLTNAHMALMTAKDYFRPENGYRKGAMKFVILFTDGNPTNEAATVQAADDLKAMGVTLITIGTGIDVSMPLLEQIASDNLAYNGDNWRHLEEIFKLILNHVKDTVTPLCTTGCTYIEMERGWSYCKDEQVMDHPVAEMTLVYATCRDWCGRPCCKHKRTYGFESNIVWVKWGCSGVFRVCFETPQLSGAGLGGAPVVPTTKVVQVTCESSWWWKGECSSDEGPIVDASVRTYKSWRWSKCVKGSNFKVENGKLITSKGCRAIFDVTVQL